jgi:uncharacterized BrkB/YihY/UPF0761 family membrane protein
MMAVDNLKEIWQSQNISKIQFSELEIYKMIHKKSASIVKWIFYISIIEFVVMIVLPFFMKDTSAELKEMNMINIYWITNGLSYIIAVIFIYLFYKNYRTICVFDSTKKLLSDILKTRKIVKSYVGFQLLLGGITALILFSKSEIILPENISHSIVWVIAIIGVFFVLLIMWLFYMLIYGILLNKLKTNYKELLNSEH